MCDMLSVQLMYITGCADSKGLDVHEKVWL